MSGRAALPAHQGMDDRRHAAPACALGHRHRETGFLKVLQRPAVAVAAVREGLPRVVQPSLPALQPGVVRTHVLQEQERSFRVQDAADLLQRCDRILDGAEHEGGDDRVEGVVVEGKDLGRCADHLGPTVHGPEATLEPLRHVLLRLGQDEPVEVLGVVPQVETGAGADLEHASPGCLQESAPTLRHAGAFGPPQDRLVDQGGQPAARRRIGSDPGLLDGRGCHGVPPFPAGTRCTSGLDVHRGRGLA